MAFDVFDGNKLAEDLWILNLYYDLEFLIDNLLCVEKRKWKLAQWSEMLYMWHVLVEHFSWLNTYSFLLGEIGAFLILSCEQTGSCLLGFAKCVSELVVFSVDYCLDLAFKLWF